MRRYEKERPNTGGAEAAVNYARNTGKLPRSWEWFWWWNVSRHEMRRALLGIDGPEAWCGDRNARLRRFIERLRTYPPLRLP
jgi:hypothetical protein